MLCKTCGGRGQIKIGLYTPISCSHSDMFLLTQKDFTDCVSLCDSCEGLGVDNFQKDTKYDPLTKVYTCHSSDNSVSFTKEFFESFACDWEQMKQYIISNHILYQ